MLICVSLIPIRPVGRIGGRNGDGERDRASVMCKWLSVATVLARSCVDANLCRGSELIEVSK